MILYLEDWSKPENSGPEGLGPIVDLNTTNRSFVEYASLLCHGMKIKNWAFCLALHDPKLQGVDPFDPNLSVEMKIRVGKELESNPWYYLRECAKVPASAGAEPLQFRAHRANVGMFWLFMSNVSFFLLQPRQTGKSVVADCINNYLMHYRTFNTKYILVTLTPTLLMSNVERLKDIRDLLPQYTIERRKGDTKAKETFEYRARKNIMMTRISQPSEAAANNVGRGLTTAIQNFDEAAFIKFMDTIWPAAAAATGAARDTAKERGEPYGTIITTTAGDRLSRSGRFMYEMYQNAASWTEAYFDVENMEELHTVVKKNSGRGVLMVGATFSHNQLGFSDDWLREKIAEANTSDKDKINRDYFNVWTAGSTLSPLTPELLEAIHQSERDPDFLQITKNGYVVKWYVPQNEIHSYMQKNHCVIGADTSTAVNRDATSFIVINIKTLETVCTVSVHEADVLKLIDFLVDFMVSFERTTLVIERASTGSTFIEGLYLKLPLYGMDPFKRIYNNIIQDREGNLELFNKIKDGKARRDPAFYTSVKSKFGFTQTGKTRDVLYKEILQLSAKRCRNIIYDKTLSTELRSLEVNERTGRIDHTIEGHDDNVMAWLLAQWFLQYGKNLAWYGIENYQVMSMSTDAQEDTIKEKERKLMESYQKEIDRLINKLVENENSVYRNVLELQIRQLNNKLTAFGIESRNIDSMIKEVKEQKMEKRRAQLGI